MYSAHTNLRDYPCFAPEVLKHSFSFEDSVLLSRPTTGIGAFRIKVFAHVCENGGVNKSSLRLMLITNVLTLRVPVCVSC